MKWFLLSVICFLCYVVSVKDKINKIRQGQINIEKEKFDSLHVEFIILRNEHDRFIYSLDHINEKYPKVVDEFIEYYETETE